MRVFLEHRTRSLEEEDAGICTRKLEGIELSNYV